MYKKTPIIFNLFYIIKKKKKFDILQRFFLKKSIKADQFLAKDQAFEAPILYKLPTHDDLKSMILKYLSKKKII